MTTKTWDGSDGHWRDGAHWTPAGVPQNGDGVVIREGTVHGTLLNLSSNPIDIGSDHPVSDPQLDLNAAVLGDVSVFDQSARTGPYQTRFADISVSGAVSENGHLAIGNLAPEGIGIPGSLDLTIADYSVFALTGNALEQASSSFTAAGASHSAFANFGSFTDFGGKADFAVPVIGSGSFTVARSKFPSGTLTFEGSVSAGQAVAVDQGGDLDLDQPLKFLGSITEQPGAEVVLKNTSSTSSSYSHGVLKVFNGSQLVAALRIDSVTGLGFDVSRSGADTTITTPVPGASSAFQMNQSAMDLPMLTQS